MKETEICKGTATVPMNEAGIGPVETSKVTCEAKIKVYQNDKEETDVLITITNAAWIHSTMSKGLVSMFDIKNKNTQESIQQPIVVSTDTFDTSSDRLSVSLLSSSPLSKESSEDSWTIDMRITMEEFEDCVDGVCQ